MNHQTSQDKISIAKAMKETDDRLKAATSPQEKEALEAKMVELMSQMMRNMFSANAPTQES